MVPPLPRDMPCWPSAHLGSHSLSARAFLICFPFRALPAPVVDDGVPCLFPESLASLASRCLSAQVHLTTTAKHDTPRPSGGMEAPGHAFTGLRQGNS